MGLRLNSSGVSLIETTISLGVLGLMMTGFMSYVVYQKKEESGVIEKISQYSLEKEIITFSEYDMCAKEFSRSGFPNTYSVTAVPTELPIQNLYTSASTDTTLATVGEHIGYAGMHVSSLKIIDIKKSADDKYAGTLEVKFDGGPRKYRDIKVNLLLATETSGGNVVLKGGGPQPSGCGMWQQDTDTLTCNDGAIGMTTTSETGGANDCGP